MAKEEKTQEKNVETLHRVQENRKKYHNTKGKPK